MVGGGVLLTNQLFVVVPGEDRIAQSLSINKPMAGSPQKLSEESVERNVHILREPGGGLGISIAGGIGSTPYKGNDRVSKREGFMLNDGNDTKISCRM